LQGGLLVGQGPDLVKAGVLDQAVAHARRVLGRDFQARVGLVVADAANDGVAPAELVAVEQRRKPVGSPAAAARLDLGRVDAGQSRGGRQA